MLPSDLLATKPQDALGVTCFYKQGDRNPQRTTALPKVIAIVGGIVILVLC